MFQRRLYGMAEPEQEVSGSSARAGFEAAGSRHPSQPRLAPWHNAGESTRSRSLVLTCILPCVKIRP